MPTAFGTFRAAAYRSTLDGSEHLALVMGDVAEAVRSDRGVGPGAQRVPHRRHPRLAPLRLRASWSRRCALSPPRGALVYLRGHEGRGIGLAHKIRAANLPDQGLDTVAANTAQGLPADSRSYGVGSQTRRSGH
jgi:3,4-dihydroxy 2-butanone 4-phosphate synthase/GTP cyclohydrolase II